MTQAPMPVPVPLPVLSGGSRATRGTDDRESQGTPDGDASGAARRTHRRPQRPDRHPGSSLHHKRTRPMAASPLASGSIVARRRQRRNQVDFYREPTVLSRLTLHQKYLEAMDRLRRHPEEALVWVAAKRPHRHGNHARYSLRQLPLHICCFNLPRAIDPTTRQHLLDLMVHLIVAHPDACRWVDHTEVLPLHAALWYGASPELVSMCLMAYPESSQLLDRRGRNNAQIHQTAIQRNAAPLTDAHKVSELLRLDVSFWTRAQMAARRKLAQADLSWDAASVVWAARQNTLLEGSSSRHGGTRETESTATGGGGVGQAEEEEDENDDDDDDSIVPMAWDQLEARAMALEQVLTEVNEANFRLTQRIDELTKTKQEIQNKLERQKSQLQHKVAALQSENEKLKAKLLEVERELADSKRLQQEDHLPIPSASSSTVRQRNSSIGRRASTDPWTNSPRTPESRPVMVQPEIEPQPWGTMSPPPMLGDSLSLGEASFTNERTAKDRHRSPSHRRRGVRTSRVAANVGLEDSIAFEELLEINNEKTQRQGKAYHDSSTSLTESCHSFKSSQSFMSSKRYIKVMDDNRKLQKELEDIGRSYREQRTRLLRLEAHVEKLQQEEKEDEASWSSSVASQSCASSYSSVSPDLELSHVSEGDECETTLGSAGPMSLSQGQQFSGPDHHQPMPPSSRDGSQDIEFIPSPSSSADDWSHSQ